MNRDKAIALIHDERERQIAKWGRAHAWGWGDCSTDGILKCPNLPTLRQKAQRRNPGIAALADRYEGELAELILEQAADDTQWQRKRDLALPSFLALSNDWGDDE